jgi:signal transduction histidine kinase
VFTVLNTVSTRLRDLRARVAGWPAQRLDVVLAAALLAEALAEGLLAGAPTAARLAVLGPAGLVAAAVALRRLEALAAVALAVAGIWSVNLLERPLQDALQGIYFGWLFVTYTMAAREEGRRLAAGVAMTVAGALLIVATGRHHAATDYVIALVLFAAGPVLAGRLLHHRLHLSRALTEKARLLERERQVRAEELVADERARIAGELHDVVAHALGAMTIQAAAARRLATKDAARASGAFEAIEKTGREALTELRTLLDVLRDEGSDRPLAPRPGMGGLEDLVDRVRHAGLPVDLEVHGSAPASLPAGIDLTAYRVVQEALGAALEHGGAGRATVWVGYDTEKLELRVADDGMRPGSRPLLGMRERVQLYGGELSAGPGEGGGHEVRARLPLEAVPA